MVATIILLFALLLLTYTCRQKCQRKDNNILPAGENNRVNDVNDQPINVQPMRAPEGNIPRRNTAESRAQQERYEAYVDINNHEYMEVIGDGADNEHSHTDDPSSGNQFELTRNVSYNY